MKILVLLLISWNVFAKTPDYEKVAKFLCSTPLNEKHFKYEDYFDSTFIKIVSEDYFWQVIHSLNDTTGYCESARKVTVTSEGAIYDFISKSGNYSTFSFHINESSFIDRMQVKDVSFPHVVLKTWNDVDLFAEKLEGKVSVTIKSDTGKSNGRDELSSHPLGSSFKLYVLGALFDSIKRGEKKWSDAYPITESWKSLPSGIMQTWSNGKDVTLREYAEYMIKISDNTATDHLIRILGRSEVEKQLPLMNNSYVSKNLPFLTTSEMFKLKWGAPKEIINQFLVSSSSEKSELLKTVNEIALSEVGKNGVSFEKPAFIEDIEWFASTQDLCEAMVVLKEKGSQEVLDILGINVPFLDLGKDSSWEYGGYKGGSEPGVLTMVYLLKSKSQHWGCVSVAWHNPKKETNQWIMSDFVRKILKVSEQYF